MLLAVPEYLLIDCVRAADGTQLNFVDESTTTQQETKAEDASRHMCI